MDEIEMIQLENIINYFKVMVKDINAALVEAKELHKGYIENGGAFIEDNYNDMKNYALGEYDYFTGLAKKEVKHLPAACKKTAEYKEALASYKAAVADLLAAIEAFEVEIEVDAHVDGEAFVEVKAVEEVKAGIEVDSDLRVFGPAASSPRGPQKHHRGRQKFTLRPSAVMLQFKPKTEAALKRVYFRFKSLQAPGVYFPVHTRRINSRANYGRSGAC